MIGKLYIVNGRKVKAWKRYIYIDLVDERTGEVIRSFSKYMDYLEFLRLLKLENI